MFILGPVDTVCHPHIQKLCTRRYPGHTKGCPRHDDDYRCPPRAPFFTDVFEKRVWLAAIVFDFKEYMELKRKEHPTWTERALRNPRHWQNHLKAELKKFIDFHLVINKKNGQRVVWVPEGMGVNMTATCRKSGLKLEWPPKNKVYKIAFIAKKKNARR